MIKLTMRHGDLRFGNRNSSGAGPVKTYYLSAEELAEVHRKYGPPRKCAGIKKPFNVWADLHLKTSRTGKKGSASNESSASV